LNIDPTIGALDNICANAKFATIGSFLGTLWAGLNVESAYGGAFLTAAQITALNSMCTVTKSVTLGTVVDELLKASKNVTPALRMSDARAKALNNMCMGAQNCTLGTLLQSISDLINHMQLSHEALISAYAIAGSAGAATIDSDLHTIAITMPHDTVVTALVATFTASTNATIKIGAVSQVSGVTANNFTTPKVYAVTSESGDVTIDWTVTVTVAAV
jgi:hypothetical protein